MVEVPGLHREVSNSEISNVRDYTPGGLTSCTTLFQCLDRNASVKPIHLDRSLQHGSRAVMASIHSNPTAPPTPPAEEAIVQLHALSAGHLTLPEKFFVRPASETARRTVPSLAFLIQHEHAETGAITRVVLDLGIRRNTNRYPEPIQRHIDTRQPLTSDPDIVKSLARGGLTPDDIDYIIYTHVSLHAMCSVDTFLDRAHRLTYHLRSTGTMLVNLGTLSEVHL